MRETEQFEDFFIEFYDEALRKASKEGKKAIEIDFNDLYKFDPNLAEKLLNDPFVILDAAREAIGEIDLPEGRVKIEPRFKNLPKDKEIRIRNIRSEHIGSFISIDGVVRRASEVKPEISVAIFECGDCENKMYIKQGELILKKPSICTECGRKGNFTQIGEKLFDSRWIVTEELFEKTTGEKPGEISVYLKTDLTSPKMQRKADPGNRLKITGVVRELKRFNKGRLKTQMDIYIEANHVESLDIEWDEVSITEEDKESIIEMSRDPLIYEKLISSLAPSIYGMEEVKESVILQLFGGVPHVLPDNTRIRGDIHILLLGDPSVAKTQILKLVSKLIPRGKYVSGRGASAAGLCGTVMKDELLGGWVLEAGAIPLCNKSVIAIDEFDKIGKEDIIAMHEALSTQTISIAKASIVATLPAEVSVLAGANPKFSRFDPYKSIADQIALPDTILSRMDLKFALRDIPDKVKDEKLASHVIDSRLTPENIVPIISPDLLRKYIAYARKHSKPKMTKEAGDRLKSFYLEMRGLYSGENVVAITLRQNEALIRLTEASAKVRMAEEVSVSDAERAIKVMMYSLKQLGYDIETGKFDIDRTEGMASSQRNKINTILDIIAKLTKQIGKQIPKEEILAVAEEEGIKENEASDILSRIKREGMIFEPKTGFVQKV